MGRQGHHPQSLSLRVPLAKYSMTTEILPHPESLLRLASSSPVVHIRTISTQLTDRGH